VKGLIIIINPTYYFVGHHWSDWSTLAFTISFVTTIFGGFCGREKDEAHLDAYERFAQMHASKGKMPAYQFNQWYLKVVNDMPHHIWFCVISNPIKGLQKSICQWNWAKLKHTSIKVWEEGQSSNLTLLLFATKLAVPWFWCVFIHFDCRTSASHYSRTTPYFCLIL